MPDGGMDPTALTLAVNITPNSNPGFTWGSKIVGIGVHGLGLTIYT